MAAERSASSAVSFRRQPLFYLACVMVSGMLAAGLPDTPPAVSAAAAAAGAAALLLAFRRGPVRVAVLGAFFVSGFFLASSVHEVPDGALRGMLEDGRVAEASPVRVEGVLVTEPEPARDGLFLSVGVRRVEAGGCRRAATGIIRVYAPVKSAHAALALEAADLGAGTLVRIPLRLERTDRFLNPGVPGTSRILDQQGIDASASLKSVLLVRVVGREPAPWSFIKRFRNALISRIGGLFSEQTAGVLSASLLGDKHFLDKRTAEVFREGGTFHALVISGMHVTFVGGLVLLLVSRWVSDRRLQFAVSAGFVWAFAVAVGAEVPVVRAAVMFTILLLARTVRRDSSTLNALGACAAILLAWRPADLVSPSFILTFLSVTAITTSAFPLIAGMRAVGSWTPSARTPLPPRVPDSFKRLCETLYWNPDLWEFESARNIWGGRIFKSPLFERSRYPGLAPVLAHAFEGLVVSMAVLVWLLPVQIFYFHRIATGGVFLNLWVGVLLAAESFLACGAIAASLLGDWAAAPLVFLTESANTLLIAGSRAVLDAGLTSVRIPLANGFGWLAWAYYLPLGFLSLRMLAWNPFDRGRRPRSFGSSTVTASAGLLLSVGALLLFHPMSEPRPNGNLRVDFLDVGQGDAALVTFPDGRTMLVDAGGRPPLFSGGDEDGPAFQPDVSGIGESVVSEFLWEKGYSAIDWVVATHADSDHMQGLSEVVGNFRVGKLLVGRMAGTDPDFVRLAEASAESGLSPQAVGAGHRMSVAGVRVEFLHPILDGRPVTASGNDDSVVLRLSYGSRVILLLGDLEADGERMLVASQESLRADVVKTGHHGSRTSSTPGFVEEVSAEIAVVSVGRRSRFGHPHPEVVERWRCSGARVLVTGLSGTVTVETDGDSLSLSEFVAGKKKNARGFPMEKPSERSY